MFISTSTNENSVTSTIHVCTETNMDTLDSHIKAKTIGYESNSHPHYISMDSYTETKSPLANVSISLSGSNDY